MIYDVAAMGDKMSTPLLSILCLYLAWKSVCDHPHWDAYEKKDVHLIHNP